MENITAAQQADLALLLKELIPNYPNGHSSFDSDKNDEAVNVFRKMSSPYHLKITNNTDVSKKCVLFGCGDYLFAKNFGSDEGLFIESRLVNVSYLLLLLQSAFKPFSVNFIRLLSENIEQVKQTILVQSKDANGE